MFQKKEVIGSNDERVYERQYTYIVNGEEYVLDTVENNSKAYKTIKYNINNPKAAKIYTGINLETIIIFFVSLALIFNPFILKMVKIQDKPKLKWGKTNITTLVRYCFWGYMAFSIALFLREFFWAPDWAELIQYSRIEIILKMGMFILARNIWEKYTSYFNIFWI